MKDNDSEYFDLKNINKNVTTFLASSTKSKRQSILKKEDHSSHKKRVTMMDSIEKNKYNEAEIYVSRENVPQDANKTKKNIEDSVKTPKIRYFINSF